MNAATTTSVRVQRHFPQDQKVVFDAWLDLPTASRFLFATPTGTMVKVEVDPRVGGKFVIVERREGNNIEHQGIYIVIELPEKLVFDFAVPQFSSQYTRVSIDVESHGPGCELTLTHEGVLPDYADRTKQGWTMILNRLAEVLA